MGAKELRWPAAAGDGRLGLHGTHVAARTRVAAAGGIAGRRDGAQTGRELADLERLANGARHARLAAGGIRRAPATACDRHAGGAWWNRGAREAVPTIHAPLAAGPRGSAGASEYATEARRRHHRLASRPCRARASAHRWPRIAAWRATHRNAPAAIEGSGSVRHAFLSRRARAAARRRGIPAGRARRHAYAAGEPRDAYAVARAGSLPAFRPRARGTGERQTVEALVRAVEERVRRCMRTDERPRHVLTDRRACEARAVPDPAGGARRW